MVEQMMGSAVYQEALRHLSAGHERFVEEIVRLTEIPAPFFGEEERGRAYLAMLRETGLEDCEMDAEGNVMGLRRGLGNGSLVVVAAHLDTVFPAGTDLTVRREGTRLFAPGVGDDTRSLAMNLAFLRAMNAAGMRTKHDILFVGNVGEEGLGDLRGVRFLFTKGRYAGRIAAFLSVEGPMGMGTIVSGATGSLRYRVTFRGPGGHSFMDFGIVSPSFALAETTAGLSRLEVPREPRTTFSASVIGGGTSVNSIPNEVWVEVDLRSDSADELQRLDAAFKAVVQRAVEAENAARSTAKGPVTVELTKIGDRPAGAIDRDSELVANATAATRALGFAPKVVASSTDASIPISLGIPGIAVSAGAGAGAHTLDEWVDVEPARTLHDMQLAFATLLQTAGLET
ncbi:M20/M25/M40 family metallo-hydrolase [Roseomonas nepalensis]|uniref:M20/M25/M40 family metallo-hydrolase n=1 Tax=Muricoccus nepalensis TaxID=1854500 RepID=A0A502FVV5_9PROT|nr:M20/M25/M40 family metallo-hydrolase [Roseomonas nepalensis]TPG53490.1 M20/M25/M40 family metallo-hydrolase [Roseomonas nepalensis]